MEQDWLGEISPVPNDIGPVQNKQIKEICKKESNFNKAWEIIKKEIKPFTDWANQNEPAARSYVMKLIDVDLI